MILSVDPSLPLPVYEQVREQIARMISAGTLAAGSQLPTIRQLAADLGLAKGTIERAYELLAADRVVERRGRHGTVVAQLPAAADPYVDERSELADGAERLALLARQLGADLDDTLAAVRRAWIDW